MDVKAVYRLLSSGDTIKLLYRPMLELIPKFLLHWYTLNRVYCITQKNENITTKLLSIMCGHQTEDVLKIMRGILREKIHGRNRRIILRNQTMC